MVSQAVFLFLFASSSAFSFSSRTATEATLRFQHFAETKSNPSKKEAIELVNRQVLHLFGSMERSEPAGVPKEDHKIDVLRTETIDRDTYRVHYSYEGTILAERGPRKYFPITLPRNPDLIFSQSFVGRKNLCTDPHYQEEGDFWYFWSAAPYYSKCPLQEGVHIDTLNASLDRLKNERTTYPEYDRLTDKEGNIDIHVYFGMDDPTKGKDPSRSADINAFSYRNLKNALGERGFVFEKWKSSNPVVPSSYWYDVTVEEASLKIRSHTFRIRLFFGPSGIDEKSAAFHYLFRDSLKNASLMIYDGHSGLGGHLDLKAIARIRGFRLSPNPNKYQIYFFNSCTSYTYYNTLYLQRKRSGGSSLLDAKGTKNLDILANGLSTYFNNDQHQNIRLIDALLLFSKSSKKTSYQRLAQRMEYDNLFVVIGDEDNPRSP